MLCGCGCGREVKSGNRFIRGHNRREYEVSEETCEKLRQANLGKKHSKETCEKRRQANLGKKRSREFCEGQRQANLGKKASKEACRNMSKAKAGEKHPIFGKKRSKETCEKIRKATLGKNLGKNLGKKRSKETCEKLRQANLGKNLGKKRSKETREKMRQANLGKKHLRETKKKLRLAAIERIEKNIKNGGQLAPNYNPDGCKLIDKYGKLHGYNFQHAENGGEFYIRELGYWLDGYDKEENIVIEIDEPFHFDHSGSLFERDVERQKEIEKFLDCKFIRLRI